MKAIQNVLGALLVVATTIGDAAVLHPLTGCCNFGTALAPVADLDGDGVVDLLVGANGSGQIYLYSGKTGASLFSVTLPASDLGASVSDAGDVNADGVTDLISGAPSFSGGIGTARVFSGIDGTALLTLSRTGTASNNFGFAVAGLGDVNNDGHSDLLVTSPLGSGEAKVMSGVDGSTLYPLSRTAGTGFGAGAGRIKDLNGDGVDDFAISAPRDGTGKVFVFSGSDGALLVTGTGDSGVSEFGTYFVFDAGDVDADGKHDVYVGDFALAGGNGAAYVFSGATGARLRKISGTAGEGLGPGRGAGDVNGDGHSDLIVGAYTYSGAGISNGGRTLLYSGSDSSVLAEFIGERNGGSFGYDAIALGDTDDDHCVDVAVSSANVNRVDIVAGKVRLPDSPFAVFQSGFELDCALGHSDEIPEANVKHSAK